MLTGTTRAKDVPSIKAEFGHPDVMIILTCLSYYYHGISEEQLRQSFDLLFKLDNPEAQYEIWTQGSNSIPISLRQLSGVNINDPDQWSQVIAPCFSRHREVVDFFLRTVVFPNEAKEFEYKLSTSAWDLAKEKNNPTTGFSGTTDGKYLLPTSICQEDPVQQSATNARVMQFLLRPENNYYACVNPDGSTPSAIAILDKIVNRHLDFPNEHSVRVLLDVGAQMLDQDNREIARAWLDSDNSAQAAIYFEGNDIFVAVKDGSTEPYVSSPFKERLDQCILFLDDIHTRQVSCYE